MTLSTYSGSTSMGSTSMGAFPGASGDPVTERLVRLMRKESASRELAWGGTQVFGGVVLDDYNPDLQGVRAMETADKMRRTLAQVRAVEKAITLPITSTAWSVDAPDGAGSAEKEAAELLRENLLGGMETSWDGVLREACLAIYYGFRVPEICWCEERGLVKVAKIASRNPALVSRWLYGPDGRLAGYLYEGNRPVGYGLDSWGSATTRNERIPIPIEKTLHFAHDQENENPQGFGLWRSQYPHWYFVHALYKITGIGVERNLLGVPYAEEGAGAQTDDRDAMLAQLSRMRAAEGGAFVIPQGWKLGWFESQRTLLDAMPLIDHHVRMIALAGLCQFLNLGMGSAGTQSLATVHASLFEQAEDAHARWIEQTLNAQLVRRWALLNYGPGLRPPKISHRPIRARDLNQWASALTGLVNGGLLHATVDDEERIRADFELPEIPKEQLSALEKERKQADQARREAEGARLGVAAAPVPEGEPGPAQEKGKPEEEPQELSDPCGGHAFSVEEVEAKRQERRVLEGEFVRRATELLEGVESGYLEVLRPRVEALLAAGGMAAGKPLPELPGVPPPLARKYEEFVRSYLREVLELGRRALAEETGQDVDARPVPEGTRSWIRARASVMAADHVGRVQTAVLTRVLSGVRMELPAEQLFSDAGVALVEALNRETQAEWGRAAAELLAMVG